MELKIVPWLQPLIDELWKNKSGYLKDPSKYTWDAPDFGGLSENLYYQIDGQHIHVIYDNVNDWYKSKTKAQFTKELIEALGNGLIIV